MLKIQKVDKGGVTVNAIKRRKCDVKISLLCIFIYDELRHRTEKRFSLSKPSLYAESDSVNDICKRKSPLSL